MKPVDPRHIDVDQIRPDQPLRLSVAAKIVFGDGMTASGLRREAAKGRLVIERIAGKDFVTIEAIQRMRALCRVDLSEPASESSVPSATNALASALQRANELATQFSKKPSRSKTKR